MKIFALVRSGHIAALQSACLANSVELSVYSWRHIGRNAELLENPAEAIADSDCILLSHNADTRWTELRKRIAEARPDCPLIVISGDPAWWNTATPGIKISATVCRYFLYGGPGNMDNLVRYLRCQIMNENVSFREPSPTKWEGLYHPVLERGFETTKDYLDYCQTEKGDKTDGYVGLLYSRSNWLNNNLEVERALIRALGNNGISVIPVFFYPFKNQDIGNLGGIELIEKFFMNNGKPVVQGIIKMPAFFLAGKTGMSEESESMPGAKIFKKLNIPLFSPVIFYRKTYEEWLASPEGLGVQAAWSMAMPELEGAIEPMIIGAIGESEGGAAECTLPIDDRVRRFAERVAGWLRLRRKPNSEKRIAFILHNNPCVSAESSIGGATHLDSLESVALIMRRLQESGYAVQPPPDGKVLIDDIMSRKALSEFRWTSVDDIVANGGVLELLDSGQYNSWFAELPDAAQKRMCEVWGNPPGEAKDGVPAAMVYQSQIVITGVKYGNAVVCVQPKRGCAGARCDGRVCKILHDPTVPPPHQYVATYKWLSRKFQADLIVHVGTHGNLEFLPGKAVGLSAGCFSDIGIDKVPHLYIYNADNPAEGTVAKRRSYATLVNHLQTVMARGELYGDLELVERLLAEYRQLKSVDAHKAHTVSHLIVDKMNGLQLLEDEITHENFESRVEAVESALALLKGTAVPKGMHVFGNIPDGERLSGLIYAIVRYENHPESLRGLVKTALKKNGQQSESELKACVEEYSLRLCRNYVGNGIPVADGLSELFPATDFDGAAVCEVQLLIDKVKDGIISSDETGSLLNGFDGGYIEPGPSGLMTRGRPDILPVGRNFYSLDPRRLPSQIAWETGKILAEKTLAKYLADEDAMPEKIAFYWQAGDIMWTEGEGLAQMMFLLGTMPEWDSGGRVSGFSVIPLAKLGRPRIDITVRVSGITRDNFPSAIVLLDEAVQKVAALEEPVELNYVRKHTLESQQTLPQSDKNAMRQAAYRIFSGQPGTYQAGTQLAVYSSAWETEKDLSEVFVQHNGYAYGKDVFGVPAHDSLRNNLKNVAVTFNKTVSDEYDLTGCCSYFGAHGGMINAVKVISGKESRNYYGDSREAGAPDVRTLKEEINRVSRGKILNPQWIEEMKKHGYKGAGEISKRVGRLYGWQSSARAVPDAVFDDVVRTFMVNPDNRDFFEKNNPWALEEMGRRMLEAAQRGVWKPADDVKEQLKDVYIEIEGWMEEQLGESESEIQGGSIDIIMDSPIK